MFYVYTRVYVCIYIYIGRKRERERERDLTFESHEKRVSGPSWRPPFTLGALTRAPRAPAVSRSALPAPPPRPVDGVLVLPRKVLHDCREEGLMCSGQVQPEERKAAKTVRSPLRADILLVRSSPYGARALRSSRAMCQTFVTPRYYNILDYTMI